MLSERIDRAQPALFLGMQKKLASLKQGKMVLCGVGPRLMELLKITRLDRVLTLHEDGTCAAARLVYTGIASVPFDAQEAAELLIDEHPTEELFATAAEQAATLSDPSSDVHASAEYRRHLVRVLTRRALEKALQRAEGNGDGT